MIYKRIANILGYQDIIIIKMESLDPICDKIGLKQLDEVSFLKEHC